MANGDDTSAEVVHFSTWADERGEPVLELSVERLTTGDLELKTQFLGLLAELGTISGPLKADGTLEAIEQAAFRAAQRLGLERVR